MSSRERKGENGQWRVVAVVELEKREARFCPFFFVIALYYFGLSQERKKKLWLKPGDSVWNRDERE
jgi:hypothetical protein